MGGDAHERPLAVGTDELVELRQLVGGMGDERLGLSVDAGRVRVPRGERG